MHYSAKLDALLPYERFLAAGQVNDATATVDIPLAGDRLLPKSKDQRICTDYSEEAIPERDPAYQLSDATLYETQTCECEGDGAGIGPACGRRPPV
jgi:hypothetical protein